MFSKPSFSTLNRFRTATKVLTKPRSVKQVGYLRNFSTKATEPLKHVGRTHLYFYALNFLAFGAGAIAMKSSIKPVFRLRYDIESKSLTSVYHLNYLPWL